MGKSILPLLSGDDFESDKYYVSVYFRSRSIIKGDWKLVNYYDGPFELYNLKNDPTEKNDLAKEYPELISQFIKDWNKYAKKQGFENNKSWNRPIGDKKRGWGYDFLDPGIIKTTPECMSDNVALDVKLSFTLSGKIDLSETKGKQIRLQKYGDSEIIWSADFDKISIYPKENKIVFNDFPVLEPNTHYYLTWDQGWLKYETLKGIHAIRPCKESAYSFRFRTKKSD